MRSRHPRPARRARALAALVVLSTCLAAQSVRAQIRLRDVAADSGIDFVLESGPTPEKALVEAVAGGVAAFDADSDGLTDIYFANGADSRSLRKGGARHWNRLYRNLGNMRFADVTERAGVVGQGYSMGVAAGDYDNDGDVDLFVAGVRANTLYRNEGGGRFSDATVAAGIASTVWSVAGGWFDYDNDGDLDLMVVNYLDWSPAEERFCGDRDRGLRIYCSPTYFDGLANSLYRNRGDGAFEDVSASSGIGAHIGKGMSVAFADFDLDGWVGRLRSQRHRGGFPLPQSRGRHLRRGRPARRCRLGLGRRSDFEHGRGFSRLRQRRPSRPARHGADPPDLPALPQRWRGAVRGCDGLERPARPHCLEERVGKRIRGPRQRRPEGTSSSRRRT